MSVTFSVSGFCVPFNIHKLYCECWIVDEIKSSFVILHCDCQESKDHSCSVDSSTFSHNVVTDMLFKNVSIWHILLLTYITYYGSRKLKCYIKELEYTFYMYRNHFLYLWVLHFYCCKSTSIEKQWFLCFFILCHS